MNAKHIARKLHSNAKANAKRRSLPFDLSLEWIVDVLTERRCQVTGLSFDYGTRHPTRVRPLAPALDRFKPHLGYTDANCRVVCNAFNVAKSDFGENVFRVVAQQYLERHPHPVG